MKKSSILATLLDLLATTWKIGHPRLLKQKCLAATWVEDWHLLQLKLKLINLPQSLIQNLFQLKCGLVNKKSQN